MNISFFPFSLVVLAKFKVTSLPLDTFNSYNYLWIKFSSILSLKIEKNVG